MDEEKKTPQELKQENNYNFAKAMSSEIGAIDKKKKTESRRLLETDTILSALEDPYRNVANLQRQEEVMRIYNNILKEIQFYKSNILCFDHYLVPIDASKYKGKEDKFFKDLRKAALELEKYHVKVFCPWVIEQELRQGEIYLYKQVGSDDLTFVKLPNDLCKVTYYKEFMSGYSIKLSGIVEKELEYYPEDIRKLYKKYKEGKLKNDKNFVDNYYKLPLEKAICFMPEVLESKGIPYYAGLLGDLSRIKDLNDANMDDAACDNFKLLQQLLPQDKDTGEVSIDYQSASMYHQAMKNQLPEGVGGISSPYPISSITLQNNSTKTYDYLNTLKTNVYDSAGVDSSLFNSDNRSTAQAVIYSAIVDSMLCRNLLEKLKVWFNYEFKNNSALKNFRLCFCDSMVYDKDAKVAAMAGRITTWASKLEYLAIQGYSPLDAVNILQLEADIDFDALMQPLMNSHVMSSKDMEDNGRPNKQEETGNPNVTKEGEE